MSSDKNMRKSWDLGPLITSGSGSELKWSLQFYMILLALIVLPIGTGYFLANQFGYRPMGVVGLLGTHGHARTVFFYIYIGAGVVLAAILLSIVLHTAGRLYKTEIHVYKNGIEGVGTGLGFAVFTGGMMHFCIEHSHLESVSAEAGIWVAKYIVVRSDGHVISVCLPNADEIVETINTRKR